jgi:hypothetical protein
MRKKLNKKQVLAIFSEMWNEVKKSNPQVKGDSVLKRKMFNDFVDSLNKDRQVSDSQAYNWSNPF